MVVTRNRGKMKGSMVIRYLWNGLRRFIRRKRTAAINGEVTVARSCGSTELAAISELASVSADTIRRLEIDLRLLRALLPRLEAALGVHLGSACAGRPTPVTPGESTASTTEPVSTCRNQTKKESVH
jgi:hypothetical protein